MSNTTASLTSLVGDRLILRVGCPPLDPPPLPRLLQAVGDASVEHPGEGVEVRRALALLLSQCDAVPGSQDGPGKEVLNLKFFKVVYFSIL